MRKCISVCILAMLLVGCSASEITLEQPDAPAPEETFFRESSMDHDNPRWTEQELLTAFHQYAEEGTTIIDCVVIPDSSYGIVGVVQYTQAEETGCWFDFLNASGMPESVGTLTEPAGEGTLEYVGNDTVTCTLIQEDGRSYTCTVAYFAIPEENTTGFKVTG